MPIIAPLAGKSWIGVLLALVGGLVTGLGFNLQKFAHDRVERLREENWADDSQPVNLSQGQGGSTYLSPFWWLGMFCTLAGEGANFAAYGFAPATLVAPLGGSSVVFTGILSGVLGREVMRRQDWLGVLHIMMGLTVVVIFAPSHDVTETITRIHQLLLEPFFLAYISILLVSIVLVFVATRKVRKPAFLLVILSAMLSGILVLSAKTLIAIVRETTSSGSNVNFTKYATPYILIVLIIFAGVFQIRFFNDAMKLAPMNEVMPVFFVLFTLHAIIAAAIMYKEFLGIPAVSIIVFIVGCAIMFLGVYLMTSERQNDLTYKSKPSAKRKRLLAKRPTSPPPPTSTFYSDEL